jgi:hypothetical protein
MDYNEQREVIMFGKGKQHGSNFTRKNVWLVAVQQIS